MAASTRRASVVLTRCFLLMTAETVNTDTCASRATSYMLGGFVVEERVRERFDGMEYRGVAYKVMTHG
jgi:hypothetical protein